MALAQCCGYFGSFVLIVVSSIALLVLLLTYFKHIRTLFYVEGNCTITTSFYTVQVSPSSLLVSWRQLCSPSLSARFATAEVRGRSRNMRLLFRNFRLVGTPKYLSCVEIDVNTCLR